MGEFTDNQIIYNYREGGILTSLSNSLTKIFYENITELLKQISEKIKVI